MWERISACQLYDYCMILGIQLDLVGMDTWGLSV